MAHELSTHKSQRHKDFCLCRWVNLDTISKCKKLVCRSKEKLAQKACERNWVCTYHYQDQRHRRRCLRHCYCHKRILHRLCNICHNMGHTYHIVLYHHRHRYHCCRCLLIHIVWRRNLLFCNKVLRRPKGQCNKWGFTRCHRNWD